MILLQQNEHMKNTIFTLASLILWAGCSKEKAADLVLVNGEIYTVDTLRPHAEALAVRDGRITKVGTNEEIEELIAAKTEVIDLKGQFAMPGFIEGHGHFSGLGRSLMQLNFLQSRSWEDIIQQVKNAADHAEPGEWIVGRGWHQEKWDSTPGINTHGYPHEHTLSAASPYNPVLLRHASGHSLFANAQAMKLAGISRETPDPVGGAIIRDSKGDPIGVFEERAMELITQVYKIYLDSLSEKAREEIALKEIELAQQECLAKGITSFQDAGATFEELKRYERLAKNGQLRLRLWTMVRHTFAEMKDHLNEFPIIDAGDHFFTCRAIKTEVDGALGSYGAWLLAPYQDKPGFMGQNTTALEEVENIATLAFSKKMQLCVHAIGDRGNRETLNIIEKVTGSNAAQKDLRWRIEHAQHLSPDDIPRFGQLGVIASMQGIHCTSDAPFVEKRLGYDRAKFGAYAWKALLKAGAVVTNGTDAPVEDVDPLQSLYATVTRKRVDSGMEFFSEQRLNREEAIFSYTMANAYAAFEEKEKGNLEKGKLADIVVLSKNLLECGEEEILDARVLYTIVQGKVQFKK